MTAVPPDIHRCFITAEPKNSPNAVWIARISRRQTGLRHAHSVAFGELWPVLYDMRVHLKIEHDPAWQSGPRYRERYWISISDGNYFPIFTGSNGKWHQIYAGRLDYTSAEAALADALRSIYAKTDPTERYRKLRAKEQVFTFNQQKHSSLRLPRKRKVVKKHDRRRS